jgi:hypothetical protein
MTTRRTGLGRGLESLIPIEPDPAQPGGYRLVAVDRITVNPDQPRSRFDDDSRGAGCLDEGGRGPATDRGHRW